MWAMIVKEFRQLKRDRRTLAMLVVLPVLLLVIFGYAAKLRSVEHPDHRRRPAGRAGRQSAPRPFQVVEVDPGPARRWSRSRLRDGKAAVGS